MAQGMKGMNMCVVWAASQKDISIVLALLHTIQYQRFCGMSFELFHVLCPNYTIKNNTRRNAAVIGVTAAQLCCLQGVRDPRCNILPH